MTRQDEVKPGLDRVVANRANWFRRMARQDRVRAHL